MLRVIDKSMSHLSFYGRPQHQKLMFPQYYIQGQWGKGLGFKYPSPWHAWQCGAEVSGISRQWPQNDDNDKKYYT